MTVSGAQNLYSIPVQLSYDPKSLQLINVSNGNFLSRDGQPVVMKLVEDGVQRLAPVIAVQRATAVADAIESSVINGPLSAAAEKDALPMLDPPA